MLDMKQLRKDIDELVAHNKEVCSKHNVSAVNFSVHYDGIDLIELIRLIKLASDQHYLSDVHFGNEIVLFASFITGKGRHFSMNAKVK